MVRPRLTDALMHNIESDTYGTKFVLIYCGLEGRRSTLDQWIARGFIRPNQPSRGSGYPARFSFSDLVAIVILKKLSEAGMSKKISAEVAQLAAKYKEPVIIDLQLMEVVKKPKMHGYYIDVSEIRKMLAEAML